MARGILIAALVLSAAVAAADPAPLACQGNGGDDALALAQAAAGSPLGDWLSARYGPVASCQTTAADGVLGVTIGFPAGVMLAIDATPAIETTRYAATLAAPAPDPAEAAKVLGAFAHWAADPGGCGLTRAGLLAAAKSHAPEASVDGRSCGCKATILHGAGGITGLRFSMAC